MRLKRAILPLMPLLRGFGLNRRVKGWNRVLFALFPLARQSADCIETRYRGLAYVAAPKHYVDWQVLTTGAYEVEDLAVFERLACVIPNATVLDIGANVGHHTFVFAALGWNVLAFEPNPDLWAVIEAKVRAARLSKVMLNRFGLGESDEILAFSVPDRRNSGTGQFLPTGSALPTNVMSLPVRRADSTLARLGIERVDLVKIDVQGFEPQALRGLKDTLDRCRPILCVEVGAENRHEIPELAALANLLPANYVFRRVRFFDLVFVRFARLVSLDHSDFSGFEGNVFCIPTERARLLDPP